MARDACRSPRLPPTSTGGDGARLSYLDRNGRQAGDRGERRPLAVCLQHEIDHLHGKLFIDYLSKLKRDMVVKKFTKQKRTEAL